MIEELLLINGIESAYSDYSNGYNNAFNVAINITYDNDIISQEEIIAIETKLNN